MYYLNTSPEQQSLNLLLAKFVFYCGIFRALLKWGTWGVGFHSKQTLKHKEDTKQNITEAVPPQCPGWRHRQLSQAGLQGGSTATASCAKLPCRGSTGCWQPRETLVRSDILSTVLIHQPARHFSLWEISVTNERKNTFSNWVIVQVGLLDFFLIQVFYFSMKTHSNP